jgi:hypothetical protein
MKKLLTIRYSKSLLMILFIGFMVCPACKEEEENTYFHHKISKNLYPLLFNEGSTWIYKNTGTALIDTVFLTSVEIDTIVYGPSRPNQGSPGEEEVYHLFFRSSQFGLYDIYLVSDYICNSICIGGRPDGVEYLSSHKIGDEWQGAEIADIYETYTVNGRAYANVVLMNVGSYGNFGGEMLNLYYVDSVGIIKKVIPKYEDTPETWELVEYNVSLYGI